MLRKMAGMKFPLPDQIFNAGTDNVVGLAFALRL